MGIRVEFFGLARLLVGQPSVEVEVPEGSPLRGVIPELARLCPPLVGQVLAADLTALAAGYTLCVNGLTFVADLDRRLHPGDAVLILPAAGGGSGERPSRPPVSWRCAPRVAPLTRMARCAPIVWAFPHLRSISARAASLRSVSADQRLMTVSPLEADWGYRRRDLPAPRRG